MLARWLQTLKAQDVDARRKAAKAIGELGSGGREGLVALERAMDNPDEDPIVRFIAAMSVLQITGEPARVVPALSLMLDSDDLELRYRGVLGLELVGPPASSSVPKLQAIVDQYDKLPASDRSFDQHLILETAKEAPGKIQRRQDGP